MKLIRSTLKRPTSTGILPTACVASQCKQHAALFAHGRDFGKRLNNADFVVGEHDRDEARVVANGVGNFLRIEPTGTRARLLFDIEQRDFVAAAARRASGSRTALCSVATLMK